MESLTLLLINEEAGVYFSRIHGNAVGALEVFTEQLTPSCGSLINFSLVGRDLLPGKNICYETI